MIIYIIGRIECTYEPAMTKAFSHGRTEAIRTVQPHTVEFTKVERNLLSYSSHYWFPLTHRPISLNKQPQNKRSMHCDEHAKATSSWRKNVAKATDKIGIYMRFIACFSVNSSLLPNLLPPTVTTHHHPVGRHCLRFSWTLAGASLALLFCPPLTVAILRWDYSDLGLLLRMDLESDISSRTMEFQCTRPFYIPWNLADRVYLCTIH